MTSKEIRRARHAIESRLTEIQRERKHLRDEGEILKSRLFDLRMICPHNVTTTSLEGNRVVIKCKSCQAKFYPNEHADGPVETCIDDIMVLSNWGNTIDARKRYVAVRRDAISFDDRGSIIWPDELGFGCTKEQALHDFKIHHPDERDHSR